MNLLQKFHLAVIRYLYRGRRAVTLHTFTTRHSYRKLSINMALSNVDHFYAMRPVKRKCASKQGAQTLQTTDRQTDGR